MKCNKNIIIAILIEIVYMFSICSFSIGLFVLNTNYDTDSGIVILLNFCLGFLLVISCIGCELARVFLSFQCCLECIR